MVRTIAGLALAFAVVSTSPAALAQTPGKARGDEPWLKFTITTQERETLKAHYAAPAPPEPARKQKPLPPGLQKKVARGGQLPPGWQKKMARGEVMDPEVYRHAEPLPQAVLVKLPPPPAGTVLVKVEGKIVRLLEATRAIIDILDL